MMKAGVPFCSFEDCRYHGKRCGLTLTRKIIRIAQARGVKLKTFDHKPRYCFKQKEIED